MSQPKVRDSRLRMTGRVMPREDELVDECIPTYQAYSDCGDGMTASVCLGGDLGLWLEQMDHDTWIHDDDVAYVVEKKVRNSACCKQNNRVEYSNPNRLTCAHQNYQNVNDCLTNFL